MSTKFHHHYNQPGMNQDWPHPPFNLVLIEPEIPPNTGNIARLCAATGSVLHLVGPLGFRLNDRSLRRAGLDYWPQVDLRRHASLEDFMRTEMPKRFFLLSAHGTIPYTTVEFQAGDYMIFGSESRGLPVDFMATYPAAVISIPMRGRGVRSLNLATAAAVVLYEGLRQVQKTSKGKAMPNHITS